MRCACALLISLQREKYRNNKERRRREGWESYVGHVTPSFRTDDKIESQSNIDLQVSLV